MTANAFFPCESGPVASAERTERKDSAARAPNAAAVAIVRTQSPSVHSRTFRIVVNIALCSNSGVSVRFIVQAYRDQFLRSDHMLRDPLDIRGVERGAD